MSEKTYQDFEGNTCSLYQMIRKEPEWAANQIQAGEQARIELAALQAELEEYKKIGCLQMYIDQKDEIRELRTRCEELEKELQREKSNHANTMLCLKETRTIALREARSEAFAECVEIAVAYTFYRWTNPAQMIADAIKAKGGLP